MKKLKCGLEKKVKDLGKKVEKNRTENEKDGFKHQTVNGKICPFMSNAKYQVACTPQCKIYRASKKGFECRFAELSPISYSLNEIRKHFED